MGGLRPLHRAQSRGAPPPSSGRAGLGTVVDDFGGSFGFHATAIADGTRTIAVGAEVVFALSPGHGGRYEARSLVPAGSTSRSHHEPA